MKRAMWLRMLICLALWMSWAVSAVAQNVPDPTNSFYVPQAGDYATPIEGSSATVYFRACPNNDGGASLPLAARIKLSIRNSQNAPIQSIPAQDICILFNGGTAAQGFGGNGADSVIANSTFNSMPLCPTAMCVQADGPTDVNGETYITFTGAGGVRDPNRKWGHYDTVLPVFALGIEIPGRLTSASATPPYVLRIKNFDHVGGLGAIVNQGETVTSVDFNAI